MRLSFDFYGITVCLRNFDEKFALVLDHLKEDFWYFTSTDEPSTFNLEVHLRSIQELSDATLQKWSGQFPLMHTRMSKAFGVMQRKCQHDKDHWSILRQQGLVEIYGLEIEMVYEITYVFLLSRVCEELEKKGWLRLHALGVMEKTGAALLLLPCGGGKSVLAVQAIAAQRKIFSDEVALTDGNVLFSFPIRIALKPDAAAQLNIPVVRLFRRRFFDQKALYPIPEIDIAAPAPVQKLIWGKAGSQFSIRPISSFEKVSYLVTVVFGLGLPQMREYLLRGENFFWLPRLAWQRFRTALRLIKNKPFLSATIHQGDFENFEKLFPS